MKFSGVQVVRSLTLALFVFVLSVVFLTGCSETPTTVGAKLLPQADLLHLDTAIVTATRSFNGPIIPATSVAPRMLIGNVNNLQCWSLFRFISVPDTAKNYPIVSAELVLQAVYHFGDTLAPFSMTVHQITAGWETDSLTIDSLKAAGFYNTSPCGVFNPSPIGDTSIISIPLDTNMIRSWGTYSDTTLTNFGLLLKPTNTGVVKGFGSFTISDVSAGPKLLLRFRDVAGNIDTTIINTGTNRYVTTGITSSWAADSTHLWVQNGSANRGYLEFDVSSVPNHAAIHKAVLELTLDAPKSQFNYYTVDSAYVYFTGDDGTTLTYILEIGTPVQVGTSKVYQFPAASMVQRWVRGSVLKRLAIAGYNESFALDLFSFYGAQSSAAVKPKLTIIYSVLQ